MKFIKALIFSVIILVTPAFNIDERKNDISNNSQKSAKIKHETKVTIIALITIGIACIFFGTYLYINEYKADSSKG
jgi:hypothetical protein